MALGALPGHVLRMILRESLVLVGLGILTGIAAAFSAGRIVASMLFDLSPADPLTYGAVAIVLTLIALLASAAPARRASRIDPIAALKTE
jgi:ABC-type antimicrobial peptide transport system permease subunit